MAPPMRVAVSHMADVYKLLKSVAIAKVISQSTTDQWVPAQSAVLTVFYGFWKTKPGSFVVDIPRLKQVEPEVLAEFKRLLRSYTDLTGQTATQLAYLQRMVDIRRQLLANLAYRIKGAQDANKVVADQALDFANQLELVLVASTVALAGCGFYIALGAVTGGMVLIAPFGLGPMFVAAPTLTAISGGMSSAGAVSAAGWLTGIGMAASAVTRAQMSAYIKVGVIRSTDVILGEKVCEHRAAKYEATITGEEQVIEEAEARIKNYEDLASKLTRDTARSRRLLKGLRQTIRQEATFVAGRKTVIATLQRRAVPWAAGAKYIPLVGAAVELQDSMTDLLEVLDKQSSE